MNVTLPSTTPRSGAVSHAEAIERWLLSDEVVLREPPGVAGGIINYREADGQWDGVYPEICGYYLQFAAHAAADAHGTRHREVAARVIAFLDSEGKTGAPLTLYRREAELGAVDWRNRCLFSFDLAIILRGLDAAETRWPGIVPPDVMRRYLTSVAFITENGRLASHNLVPGGPAVTVPVKWSTTLDVHHVKSAAALAGLAGADLSSVAQHTADDEAAALEREGQTRMRELHPFLYSIEGWLTLWAQTSEAIYLRRASASFAMLCQEFDPATGDLPAFAGRHEVPVRADVLAQALRAGLILEAAAQLGSPTGEVWRAMAPRLHANLEARISATGGVEFDAVRRDRNTWASMFAWQAFRFWDQAQTRSLDVKAAAASLI